jgi:hypothetical protein
MFSVFRPHPLLIQAPDTWRSLHDVAGGQFYAIGKGFNLKQGPNVDD